MGLNMKVLRPQLVTFDAFGTLYSPRNGVMNQYAHYLMKYHGVRLDETAANQAFKKAVSSQYPLYGKHKGIFVDEWWAKVVRQTLQESINEKVSDSMVSGLYTYFSTKSPYELHINVVELLQRWCMIDIKLGIISNSDPRLRMVIQDFDLEKFLYSKDSYSISYEVDFEKPDVCIFKDAEQRLQSYLALTKSDHGIDRRRLWHVGDDLEKDFKGSLKAGWNAVLVDRSRKFLDSPGSLEGLDGAVVEHSFDGRLALIRSSPIGIICDSLISLEEIF